MVSDESHLAALVERRLLALLVVVVLALLVVVLAAVVVVLLVVVLALLVLAQLAAAVALQSLSLQIDSSNSYCFARACALVLHFSASTIQCTFALGAELELPPLQWYYCWQWTTILANQGAAVDTILVVDKKKVDRRWQSSDTA